MAAKWKLTASVTCPPYPQHSSENVSSVDHLVHMTWNALAHAFEGRIARCERNATVVLEDDLLPAHDLMEYMS